MKNVVLTGDFAAPRSAVAERAINSGIAVFGAVTKDIDTVVVGTSMMGVSAKVQRARDLYIEVITESEFIKRLAVLEIRQMNDFVSTHQCRCVDVKIQLPGEIHNVNIKGVVSYDWNVGDTCWVSNDAGYHFGDDMFEFIGDDVTLEIIALYDNDGTPMSVVRRHPQGAHQCFRVDMLRPIKSKRDKVIDRAVEASAIKQTGFLPNYHRKIIERLYDEELLKDVEL